MTSASKMALQGMRDLSMLKWYVIPLFAIVLYIYTKEIKKARESKNWNAVWAALTLFGMDFFNETWNGLVFHFTKYSAFWTVPGDTALRTMMGWNIEIMFMFSIAGFIFYHTISEDKKCKILGIPNQWFWALFYSAFCVVVECFLNIGGHLVWEYGFWARSWAGVWLIFLFGYFHFYVAVIIVINMRSDRHKIITIATIYSIPIIVNTVCLGLLGWQY